MDAEKLGTHELSRGKEKGGGYGFDNSKKAWLLLWGHCGLEARQEAFILPYFIHGHRLHRDGAESFSGCIRSHLETFLNDRLEGTPLGQVRLDEMTSSEAFQANLSCNCVRCCQKAWGTLLDPTGIQCELGKLMEGLKTQLCLCGGHKAHCPVYCSEVR